MNQNIHGAVTDGAITVKIIIEGKADIGQGAIGQRAVKCGVFEAGPGKPGQANSGIVFYVGAVIKQKGAVQVAGINQENQEYRQARQGSLEGKTP